jgi:hypothetical protein
VQKNEAPDPAYRTVRVRDGQAMPILARQDRGRKLSALSR